MSPQKIGHNSYMLLQGECLKDYEDPNLIIEGPEMVREEEMEIGGEKVLRYQGPRWFVGVKANDIYEAIAKCGAERK